MRTLIIVTALIVRLLPAAWAQSKSAFQTAHEKNDIFTLRTEVTEAVAAPLFYRGAIEAAANRISTAKTLLHSAISADPDSDQAYEARDLLGNMFFRNGMYRAAFQEIQAALKQRPEASDAKQMQPIASALNSFPEMMVLSLRPSTMHIEPKSIFLPLQINGHDAEFFFDTGAGSRLSVRQKRKSLAFRPKPLEARWAMRLVRECQGFASLWSKTWSLQASTFAMFLSSSCPTQVSHGPPFLETGEASSAYPYSWR